MHVFVFCRMEKKLEAIYTNSALNDWWLIQIQKSY